MSAHKVTEVDVRVLDNIPEASDTVLDVRSCGCQLLNGREEYEIRLCPYHDGMNDGLAMGVHG